MEALVEQEVSTLRLTYDVKHEDDGYTLCVNERPYIVLVAGKERVAVFRGERLALAAARLYQFLADSDPDPNEDQTVEP